MIFGLCFKKFSLHSKPAFQFVALFSRFFKVFLSKNLKFILIFTIILFSSSKISFAKDDFDEIDSGIHEPLFIDLVRPINSKKGDLEINSLCHGKSSKKIECAPEIEYVVKDGLAFEIELPMDYDGKIQSIKTAAQQRILFGNFSKHYDHAYQVIGERNVSGDESHLTFFYISGYNKKDISLVALNGFRKDKGEYSLLLNATLYKSLSHNFAYGIEFNYDQKGDVEFRILPQIKYHLSKLYELQVGAGFEDSSAIMALRLILAF